MAGTRDTSGGPESAWCRILRYFDSVYCGSERAVLREPKVRYGARARCGRELGYGGHLGQAGGGPERACR
eukprot:3176940-Rhodomonas_salina.1